MSYLVLARKWRPQTFDDLVGQGHVSRTLANAIAANRVAHAFLFTGVRGVGKTTSARILAKALNCEKGPTAEPCLVCAPCKDIAAGADVDVLEIDAASHTSVDDVRELQKTMPYRPSRDRFKIYIVDEVHMLSNNAWNAFLKSLEEPPPHVKFIFATTEVHKVPVTILSRCQRYDFKLIPTQLIAKRLKYVLDEEKIEADDAAISIIAREAAGSMRDGMSLLDQAIAWGGDRLTGEEVGRVLGVAARSVLHQLASALVDGDPQKCLEIVASLADEGHDIGHVTRDFLALLRDVVVAKVCEEPGKLLDLADEEARDVRELAERSQADDLIRLHQGFSRSLDDIVRSGQPRAALEMALVRLAKRPPLIPLDDLVARLANLERRLGGGSPGPGPGPGPSGGPPSGGHPGPRPFASGPAPFRPPARPGDSSSSSAPIPARAPAPAPVPVRTPTPAPAPAPAPSPSLARAPFPSPALAPRPAPFSAPTPSSRPSSPAPARPTSPPLRAVSSAPPAPRAPLPDSVDLPAWQGIIDGIRAARPDLASVLAHAAPTRVDRENISLAYDPHSFLAERARETTALELLTRIARAHFGAETEIAIRLDERASGMATIAWIEESERHARLEKARLAVAEHPLVKAAIDVLGAELREVRLQSEEG